VQHFDALIQERQMALRNRLLSYQDALCGVASLIQTDRTLTPQQWKSYIEGLHLERRYPGIAGLGYTAFVPDNKLSQYVKYARAHCQSDFAIHAVPTAVVGPPQTYTDHFIVQFTKSLTPSKNSVGLDVGTEPKRRHTMELARDTGMPQ